MSMYVKFKVNGPYSTVLLKEIFKIGVYYLNWPITLSMIYFRSLFLRIFHSFAVFHQLLTCDNYMKSSSPIFASYVSQGSAVPFQAALLKWASQSFFQSFSLCWKFKELSPILWTATACMLGTFKCSYGWAAAWQRGSSGSNGDVRDSQ